jgi:ArsR family transcriptional regulator
VAKISQKQAAQIAKALSDRVRLRTYAEIARRQQVNAGELEVCNLVSKATVSHHLRVLTQAGLVSSVRNGQYVVYRAIPKRLVEYGLYLSDLANPGVIREKRRPGSTRSEQGKVLRPSRSM